MLVFLISFVLGLTVHLDGTVDNLELVVTDSAGEVVGQTAAPVPGSYLFDDLAEGTYTVRAMVQDRVVASFAGIVVPLTESVEISVSPESVEQSEQQQEAGARRNQNINVNLIDTQALIESLDRQGAQVRPITEFSAARQNYAAELGGVGRSPQLIRAARRPAFHGEIYETHNNHTLNARTFFQVGELLPSRVNQYGFRFGGPLGSDQFSFLVTGEEIRESGFVNGNVLVPLPHERTSTAADPAVHALVQEWLAAYPAELPNRPEIDPRLLNTNAIQKIRNTEGTLRLDWEQTERQQFSMRYSFADNFIDGFELVGGQNPDQRLRPQTLNLALERQLSDRSRFGTGFNFVRRKAHILVPPGSIGPFVNTPGLERLGARFDLPIRRVNNDFEYLLQGSTAFDVHQFDWGGFVERTQLNEFQADGARGVFSIRANLGRSGIENFLRGEATRYTVVLGELYRGFRRTNFSLYVSDRIRLAPSFHLTLGLRYEFAGKPSEVNRLTRFPQGSDTNNLAPRIGLAWASGATTFRAGYGIAYGSVFPATFRLARLNPPEVLRVNVQTPDLLDPLKDFVQQPGELPRSGLNLMDPELVTPYSHQYTLDVTHELPRDVTLRATYVGSRTWKLFRVVRENRAEQIDGIPRLSSTINARRPDPRFFSIARMTNQARGYFDAAQFSVEKVFGQGLALRATYTWSKALDSGSNFSNPGTNTQERLAQDESIAFQDLKARSSFDAPHSFVASYTFRLPGRTFRAWSVSGTTILKDGTPFTVQTGNDSPGFGNVDGERGDRPSILDPSLLGRSVDDPDTALAILRRDAFDVGAPFRDGSGNLSRNAFRKDGTTNFNVAISRTFAISSDQTRSLLFRAEFVNAFNHPQFSEPNSRMAAESFGQITDTQNAGRIIQFSLRLSF